MLPHPPPLDLLDLPSVLAALLVLLSLLTRAASALDHAAGWLAQRAGLRAEPDPRVVAHARAHTSGRARLRVVGGAA